MTNKKAGSSISDVIKRQFSPVTRKTKANLQPSAPLILRPPDFLISTPLIFIPGIMGSRLFVKWSSEPIWPPVGWWDHGHFKPRSIRDLVELQEKEVSQNDPLFPLVYSELLRFLENMGYIVGRNFWIFAYDWTQSNRKSGEQLAQLIQTILSEHPQWKSVDIVNHSMGGLVTRAAGKLYAAPLRRTVYITSPHFGAPKAYFALHPKVDFSVFQNFFGSLLGDLAWKWYLHRFGNTDTIEKEVKWLSRQVDSVYELLPDKFYFNQNHSLLVRKNLNEEVPIWGLESTYFADPWKFPTQDLNAKVRQAMAFKEELGDTLPGLENLVIYSDSEETIDRITYREHLGRHFGAHYDSGQRGDTMVPTDSASLNNCSEARKVKGTHNGVPNSQETGLLVRDFLLRP